MLTQKEHANGGVSSHQKDNSKQHHTIQDKGQLMQNGRYLVQARRAFDQNIPHHITQPQRSPQPSRTGHRQSQRPPQPVQARHVLSQRIAHPAQPLPHLPQPVRVAPAIPACQLLSQQRLPNQSQLIQSLDVAKNLSDIGRVHGAVLRNDAATLRQFAIEFTQCPEKFALFYTRIDHALLPYELHCRNTPIQIAYDKKLLDVFALLCKLSFALKKKGFIDFKKIHVRDNAILSCYKECYRSTTLEELLGLPAMEAKLASTSYASIWQLQSEDKVNLNVHRQKPFTNLTLFLPIARSREQKDNDNQFDDLSLSKVDLEFFNQLLDSESDHQKCSGATLHSSAILKPAVSS